MLHHKGLHAVAGTVIPYASLPVTDPPSLSADHFVWMPYAIIIPLTIYITI